MVLEAGVTSSPPDGVSVLGCGCAALKEPSTQMPPSAVPVPVLRVTTTLPVLISNWMKSLVVASPTQNLDGLLGSRLRACKLLSPLILNTVTDVKTPPEAFTSLTLVVSATRTPWEPSPGGRIRMAASVPLAPGP